MELKTINMTSFEEKPDSPACITIGGTTATGKRVETYRIATPVFMEAAQRLLKPLLEGVLERSHAIVRKELESMDASKAAVSKAHAEATRELRRLFQMTASQAVNQTIVVEDPVALVPQ